MTKCDFDIGISLRWGCQLVPFNAFSELSTYITSNNVDLTKEITNGNKKQVSCRRVTVNANDNMSCTRIIEGMIFAFPVLIRDSSPYAIEALN